MPRYVKTIGLSSLAIGVCDRCHLKFPLVALHPDRNSPGLMVCDNDNDVYDPWRLPARIPEIITLPFVRPDVTIDPPPAEEGPTIRITEDGITRITEDDVIRSIDGV